MHIAVGFLRVKKRSWRCAVLLLDKYTQMDTQKENKCKHTQAHTQWLGVLVSISFLLTLSLTDSSGGGVVEVVGGLTAVM